MALKKKKELSQNLEGHLFALRFIGSQERRRLSFSILTRISSSVSSAEWTGWY
jgi:hypothetical protein